MGQRNTFTDLMSAIDEAHFVADKAKSAFVIIQEMEGYMRVQRRCDHNPIYDAVLYSTHRDNTHKSNLWAKNEPLTLAEYHAA